MNGTVSLIIMKKNFYIIMKKNFYNIHTEFRKNPSVNVMFFFEEGDI